MPKHKRNYNERNLEKMSSKSLKKEQSSNFKIEDIVEAACDCAMDFVLKKINLQKSSSSNLNSLTSSSSEEQIQSVSLQNIQLQTMTNSELKLIKTAACNTSTTVLKPRNVQTDYNETKNASTMAEEFNKPPTLRETSSQTDPFEPKKTVLCCNKKVSVTTRSTSLVKIKEVKSLNGKCRSQHNQKAVYAMNALNSPQTPPWRKIQPTKLTNTSRSEVMFNSQNVAANNKLDIITEEDFICANLETKSLNRLAENASDAQQNWWQRVICQDFEEDPKLPINGSSNISEKQEKCCGKKKDTARIERLVERLILNQQQNHQQQTFQNSNNLHKISCSHAVQATNHFNHFDHGRKFGGGNSNSNNLSHKDNDNYSNFELVYQ